jgi:hypothetical protein
MTEAPSTRTAAEHPAGPFRGDRGMILLPPILSRSEHRHSGVDQGCLVAAGALRANRLAVPLSPGDATPPGFRLRLSRRAGSVQLGLLVQNHERHKTA